MRRLAFSLLAVALIAAVPALAQEEPPARVGRSQLRFRAACFHTAGETAWSAAAVNYPVATGGSFWAEPQSRAELRIGSRTIDLAANTQLDIIKLDQQVMKLGLPQGGSISTCAPCSKRKHRDRPAARLGLAIAAGHLRHRHRHCGRAGADRGVRGQRPVCRGTVEVAVKAGDTAVISGKETLTASVEHATPTPSRNGAARATTASSAWRHPIMSRRR